MGYEFSNGKLTLNMVTQNTYIDVTILIVEQFTSGSSIAKYKGSLIAQKVKSVEWSIK